MNKQEFARRRNWMKARLKGFHYDREVLTLHELVLCDIIDDKIELLMKQWDASSRVLGLDPLPLYEITEKEGTKNYLFVYTVAKRTPQSLKRYPESDFNWTKIED